MSEFGLFPTILSGGVGARLWPVSNEAAPKPFMPLADGETLMQKTFARAAALTHVEEIVTVVNRELFFRTRDEYEAKNGAQLPLRFILEPMGRNTAPAIAAAALNLQSSLGDDATMLVLAADHLIDNTDAFADAVNAAQTLAQQGLLVTFGITPNAPETGFGYIQRAAQPLAGSAAGYKAVRFVEKPDAATAQAYLDSGEYSWNSGMFCFTAGNFVRALEAHAPEVLREVRATLAASHTAEVQGNVVLELAGKQFAQTPNISVDYAVMEKSDAVAVVPCDIGWNDIGSWSALAALTAEDANGNRINAQTVLHDVTGCYLQSANRMIGAVGIENLIVIDTPDALLIAHADRTQDVKQLVKQLKTAQHTSTKLHPTVHRPWGTYTVVEEGERFKMKRIVVKPGAMLSMQMHHHRSEHWIVVQGSAMVTNNDESYLVRSNESTYIPAGNKHRLHNPGKLDLVMIEVQSGEYLGEDDIVRFEDQYGRADVAKPTIVKAL